MKDILFLVAALLSGNQAYAAPVLDCTVSRVVDGDTFVLTCPVLHDVKVRLACVNAPETSTSAGLAAKQAMQAYLPAGTPVSIISRGEDKYGRLLAHVYASQSVEDYLLDRHMGEWMSHFCAR